MSTPEKRLGLDAHGRRARRHEPVQTCCAQRSGKPGKSLERKPTDVVAKGAGIRHFGTIMLLFDSAALRTIRTHVSNSRCRRSRSSEAWCMRFAPKPERLGGLRR